MLCRRYVLICLVFIVQKFKITKPQNIDLIVLDLAQALHLQHIIIIGDKNADLDDFKDAKMYSKNFIAINFKTPAELVWYMVPNSYPNANTALIFKFSFINIANVFVTLNQVNLLHKASRFTWIIILNVCPTQEESQYFNFPFNCEFIVVCPKNVDTFHIIEKFSVKAVTFTVDYGSWSSNSGLTISKVPFYNRRMNLNGTIFNLKSQYSYNLCENKRTCLLISLLTDTGKKMNFWYNLLPGRITSFAEADFFHDGYGYHADFMTDDQPMSFIGPIYKTTIDWYIKYPTIKEHEDYYIRPFTVDLWLAILATVFLGALLVGIVLNVKKKLSRSRQLLKYRDCPFTALESFLNQDGSKNKAFRIITFPLQFTALFTTALYSAAIISYLAIRTPQIPFRNLEEFVKNGKYVLAKIPEQISEGILTKSSDSLMQLVNQNYSSVTAYAELADKVCNEKHVMITIRENFYDYEKRCKLLKIKTPLYFLFVAMAVPLNSPFVNIFQYHLHMYYSGGIIDRLERPSRRIGKESTENDFKPVKINQMFQIFLFVPVGVVFAATILICELILNCLTAVKSKKCEKIYRNSEMFLLRINKNEMSAIKSYKAIARELEVNKKMPYK